MYQSTPWICLKHTQHMCLFVVVLFSCSVVSDSLQPHEPQHARPLCPSPALWVHPNSCPQSWWCHPTISSSVIPFSCPQSFPASGSFQMSQLFISGSLNIGVSASTSVLPMNTQSWSLFFFFNFLIFYFYFILLYNTVLVLLYIDMNPPRVYMRSQMDWLDLLAVQGTFRSLLKHHS